MKKVACSDASLLSLMNFTLKWKMFKVLAEFMCCSLFMYFRSDHVVSVWTDFLKQEAINSVIQQNKLNKWRRFLLKRKHTNWSFILSLNTQTLPVCTNFRTILLCTREKKKDDIQHPEQADLILKWQLCSTDAEYLCLLNWLIVWFSLIFIITCSIFWWWGWWRWCSGLWTLFWPLVVLWQVMKDPSSWSQHGHRKDRHDEEAFLKTTNNQSEALEISHDIIRINNKNRL